MDAAVKSDAALLAEVSEITGKLAAVRQDLGLTRDAVAERLGVGRSTVREWEHGKQLPTLTHLLTWCWILGLRITLTDPRGKVLRPRVDRRGGETWASREARRMALALRSQRVARERSQHWLAECLGIARPSVSRLENGGTTPRVLVLARWAALFGCGLGVEPVGRG